MKLYRIRSGNRWYVGQHTSETFGKDEDAGAIFRNREKAEREIRSHSKNSNGYDFTDPKMAWRKEDHDRWTNAVVVEYDLVRIVN